MSDTDLWVDCMKKIVYLVDNSKKKELNKVLSENPYEDLSFSKLGYTLKDGIHYGHNGKQIVYVKVYDEDQEKFVHEKLKELGEELTGEEKEKVIQQIEKEEEAAQSGFGAIFG